MKKVYCEVELDNVICGKVAYVKNEAEGIEKINQVRSYFEELGYTVGTIKIR